MPCRSPRSTDSPCSPLTVVCAPDSFKGSLSALEAAVAMERGIRAAPGCANVEVRRVPLADGGEGTVEAMVEAAGGVYVHTEVVGPLGERRRARWGVIDGGRTAVLEMAEAAGLPLVPPARRDPLRTTTYGVGQLIRAALDRPGVERLVIGVGGSATCDGGIGMAQALGARFETTATETSPSASLSPPSSSLRFLTGGDLARLVRLDPASLPARRISIDVLCDVRNPLLGPEGAAAVYAPQKGATPEGVERLERGLTNLASLWGAAGLGEPGAQPGAGAAGGLAAGLVAFLGARLVEGIETVLDTVAFDRALSGADLVLAGEGAFNRQTLAGKAIAGVARRCRLAGVPLVVLAGSLREAPRSDELDAWGSPCLFSILDAPRSESEAMTHAAALLARSAGEVVRLFLRARNANRR